MTDTEIEKLIHMNQRLQLLLGYALAFIHPRALIDDDIIKYKWLTKSVENLLYLDKPLPPMP